MTSSPDSAAVSEGVFRLKTKARPRLAPKLPNLGRGNFRLAARLTPLVLTFSLCAQSVRAGEASAVERAAAETLFNDALALLESGNAADACPKLEESQRLDPGVGTLLYLADCYQQTGRTASAWATFRDAAYQAKERGDERQGVAVELADALEARLSYLQIRLTEDPDVNVEVTQNGRVLGDALLGSPVPVDPGVHELQASAAGRQPWSKTVTIAEGPAVQEVTVPHLLVEEPEVVEVAVAPPDGVNHQTIVAWSLVGVGALGLVGGSVFALMAKSTSASADDHCLPGALGECNETGVSRGEEATQQARLAGVSAGVGLAAAAAGAALLLWDWNEEEASPPAVQASIERNGASVSWTGRW